MNQMIICDCVVKIFCFALVLPIYASIYSLHGSELVGKILCGFLSFLASLFKCLGKEEGFRWVKSLLDNLLHRKTRKDLNLPFSEKHNVDHPVSLYAATKRSNELIAHTYSHLYNLPCTGLRFFTVYGPWGRPDMALFLFTNSIIR